MGPALAVAARRHGFTGAIPEPANRRLEVAYRRNRSRNVALRSQLQEAIAALNAGGIVPLLLKGSLYMLDGTFPDPGERVQWDLDLVVAPAQRRQAIAALERIGYQTQVAKPFLHPHETLLRRPGAIATVELHESLGSPPLPELLPLEDVLARSQDVPGAGGEAAGLAPADAVVHHVVHAQIQDLNYAVAGIPLRQLHTLSRLLAHRDDEIDWGDVRSRLKAPRLNRSLVAYLHHAHRLLDAPVPSAMADNPRASAHLTVSLVFWQLGWPADVLRNLRFAFGTEYLESLYGNSRMGRGKWWRRLRHAVNLLRHSPSDLLGELRQPRI